MRLRPLDVRRVRKASVYTIAALLLACGQAGPEPEPLPSAAQMDRANEAPYIASVSLEPAAPEPGSSVRAVVDARDPDGDPVKMTYAWTLDGEAIGAGLSKLALRGGSRDERLEVTVVASDGRADSAPRVVSVGLANRPPRVERLLMGPALEITAGTGVEVEAQAHDDDGDPIELHHTWKVNGDRSAHTGPSFATAALETGDVLTVEVRASDGTHESEPLESPPIRVVNRPPRVVSRPGASIPEVGFRYLVQAEDPDGDDSLRFELDLAPDGMQIDAVSGEVTWKPRSGQAGTHPVRIVVDDQKGGRIAHAFEVQVGGSPSPASEG
jgi:hypothetical protein